jgi:hypothetical protein
MFCPQVPILYAMLVIAVVIAPSGILKANGDPARAHFRLRHNGGGKGGA